MRLNAMMSAGEAEMRVGGFLPGSMSSSVLGLRTDVTVDSINKPASRTKVNLMLHTLTETMGDAK
jgi:hypothetical protein